MSPTAAMECRDVWAGYGDLRVLQGVSITLAPGEIIALLGPNGVGKSTLLGCLSGQVRGGGAIWVGGVRVDHLPSHTRAREGLGLVPSGRGLFPELTVLDNLKLGARLLPRAERHDAVAAALKDFPRLRERQRLPAGSLSGGEQQMLAIARTLTSHPQVLMLDEPTQGLAPAMWHHLADLVIGLRGRVAIVLAEQNHAFAAKLADGFVVLAGGQVANRGDRDDLQDRETLIDSYINPDNVRKTFR